MRQVLSWRFIAAIAAILILLVVVNAMFNREGAIAEIVEPSSPVERDPTLISLILQAEGPGFGLSPTGQATTDLVLTLPPDDRQVRIFAGTPGEVTCPDLTAFGQCAVLAEGVAMAPGAYEAVFVGLAHDDAVIDELTEAAGRAAERVGSHR